MDAEKLRYFARKKEISLTKLAVVLDINPSTLSRKLNGTTEFNREEIQKIKNLLHLSISEINSIFFD